MSPGAVPESDSLDAASQQRKGYIINGSPPQQEPANRARRPKWRLCFRLDRQTVSAKESLEHLAPKYQHDFFLTVVDPPATGSFRESPPAPFFASRVACHVADLVASRPMIAQLAGRSFEGKALACIGAECMAAGLCAAMLGAKIAFVCERSLEPHVQHNVRLFRRDTLDYTKTKTNVLAVAPCSPGRCGHLEAEVLSEKLQAPSLDMVVLTEVSFARVVGDFGGLVGNRRGEVSAIFQMLGKLIPARSCTKALVICDHSFAMSEESNRRARADEEGDGLPPGLSAALPPEWHARPFCVLPQGIPVIWLERQDAELVRRKPAPIVPRAPMPPMGASSSRCGCGGHMQSPLLGQRVESKEWFANNAKLKEALQSHNSVKQMEASHVLREARAWSDSVSLSQFLSGGSSKVSYSEPSQCSTEGLNAAYCNPKSFRTTLPAPSSAREHRSCEKRRSKKSISESSGRGKGSHSARQPTIAERHASPPHWYSCNRAVYGM